MTSTAPPFDYDACRKRLEAVTTDPAVMAGFDRIRETGDLDDAFMEAVVELNISLDWLFLGKGAPHREGVS